ncbi:unnamed protein product, partial [Heterotrigona itama]
SANERAQPENQRGWEKKPAKEAEKIFSMELAKELIQGRRLFTVSVFVDLQDYQLCDQLASVNCGIELRNLIRLRPTVTTPPSFNRIGYGHSGRVKRTVRPYERSQRSRVAAATGERCRGIAWHYNEEVASAWEGAEEPYGKDLQKETRSNERKKGSSSACK